MTRAPYQQDPNAWDRASRHAYDVREFYAMHHARDLEQHAKPWERAIYLMAGALLGLSIATFFWSTTT